MLLLLIFGLFLHSGYAYFLHLNESQYARMPRVFHLDRYDTCLHENNDSGVYCTVKFDLVTDEHSDLFDMIRNYSARVDTNFNHSQLTHGICLTKSCKKFYKQNVTADLRAILEACLNETMWRDYRLKTRVPDQYTCQKLSDTNNIDTSDIVVAVVLAILLLLNLIGSLQDFFVGADSGKGSHFLACFSVRGAWKKLTAPGGEGPEPRLTRLKGFYGIKTMNMIFVIMAHAALPAVQDADNPRYFEEAYQTYPIMGSGTLIIQTFFMISGFLFIYNLLIDGERNKTTWILVPKAIINRWLRLTPSYLVVLAITATWFRHFGTGPLWPIIVGQEIKDCRKYWWLHPLYINNYNDTSQCMMHTWYVAADFQLYCLGVIVSVLSRGRWRNILLGTMFLAGVAMPAAHTYFQDLDGLMMLSPEASRTFLLSDPTFNHTYKRGHTNLASFVIGLAAGIFVYYLQLNDTAYLKVAKFRRWFPLSFPLMMATLVSASIFYRDAPRASIYLRVVYAAIAKPLFGFFVTVLIIGMIFKFENVYRRILEWPGWAAPSRLTYCVYIIHVLLVKWINATRTTTVHLSFLNFLAGLTSCNIISFLAAVPLHLLVEAPFYALVKLVTSGPPKRVQKEQKKNDISLVENLRDNNASLKEV